MQDEQKFLMLQEEHSNAMELSKVKQDEAELALEALKRKSADEELSRIIRPQHSKRMKKFGEVKFDIDNIKTTEENRHMLPGGL